MTDILVLCAANICRSVMAQFLLARHLAAAAAPAGVRSAGLLGGGDPPPPEVVSVMAGYGIEVGGHRSRILTPRDLTMADLVVAMARAQVRHAVVTTPDAWPRTFTLKELLRRGERIGPRSPDQALAGWLAQAHVGRERSALLGDSPEDDIADPFGGPSQGYTATAALLDQLLGRLVGLCWPNRTRVHRSGHPDLANG